MAPIAYKEMNGWKVAQESVAEIKGNFQLIILKIDVQRHPKDRPASRDGQVLHVQHKHMHWRRVHSRQVTSKMRIISSLAAW
jgi:hypothetical protein